MSELLSSAGLLWLYLSLKEIWTYWGESTSVDSLSVPHWRWVYQTVTEGWFSVSHMRRGWESWVCSAWRRGGSVRPYPWAWRYLSIERGCSERLSVHHPGAIQNKDIAPSKLLQVALREEGWTWWSPELFCDSAFISNAVTINTVEKWYLSITIWFYVHLWVFYLNPSIRILMYLPSFFVW